jgi:hypothetical protein
LVRQDAHPQRVVYLTSESAWDILDASEAKVGEVRDFPLIEKDDVLRKLGSIGDLEIERVELGEPVPNLVLVLRGQKALFVSGENGRFESWQCGIAWGSPDEFWLVVGCPGSEVAIWTPDTFRTGEPTA